jgi:hypothetical protein
LRQLVTLVKTVVILGVLGVGGVLVYTGVKVVTQQL